MNPAPAPVASPPLLQLQTPRPPLPTSAITLPDETTRTITTSGRGSAHSVHSVGCFPSPTRQPTPLPRARLAVQLGQTAARLQPTPHGVASAHTTGEPGTRTELRLLFRELVGWRRLVQRVHPPLQRKLEDAASAREPTHPAPQGARADATETPSPTPFWGEARNVGAAIAFAHRINDNIPGATTSSSPSPHHPAHHATGMHKALTSPHQGGPSGTRVPTTRARGGCTARGPSRAPQQRSTAMARSR